MSRELVALTRDLCGCGAQRGISTSRPSISHEIADAESWTLTDCTDWKLIQEDRQPDGSIRSGPLCLQTGSSVPSLLQLAARSLCTGNRCPSPTHQGFCEPTLGSHMGVPHSPHRLKLSNLEDTTMVFSIAGDASGLILIPTLDSTACSSDKLPVGNHPSAGRMAYHREKYRVQELSEEVSSLLLSSWRTKTNKSYDSLFGKWHSWYLSSLGKGN